MKLSEIAASIEAQGLELMAIEEDTVCVYWPEDDMFVTWKWYFRDKVYFIIGHYFENPESAMADFKERI